MTRTLLLFITLFVSTVSAQVVERGPTPRLCDHYGDPLPEGAIRRFGTVRFFHPQMRDFKLTDDDKTLITIGADGTIKWWSVATGKMQHTARLADDHPHVILLSHDGGAAATRSGNKFIFWDLRETPPKQTHVLDTKGRDLYAHALAPDGSLLVCSDNKEQQLVQLRCDGKPAPSITFTDREHEFSKEPFPHSSLSADGHSWLYYRIVNDKPLGVYDLKTGKPRLLLDQTPGAAGLSRTGATLATCTIVRDNAVKFRGLLKFFDVEQQRFTADYQLPFAHCDSRIYFSPDDRYLAIGGSPTGLIFDRQTKQVVTRIPAFLSGACFSRDSQRLLFRDNNHIRIWDLKENREHEPRPNATEHVELRNPWLLSESRWTGTKTVWEVATGKPLHQFFFEQDARMSTLHAGQLVVLTHDMKLETYEPVTGKRLRSVALEKQPAADPRSGIIYTHQFSADGRRFAEITIELEEQGFPKRIVVWDAHTGKQLAPPKNATYEEQRRSFDPREGLHIVFSDGVRALRDRKTGLRVVVLAEPSGATQLSDDDTLLVYQAQDKLVDDAKDPLHVWDILTNKLVCSIPAQAINNRNYHVDLRTQTLLIHDNLDLRTVDLVTGKEQHRLRLDASQGKATVLTPLFEQQQVLLSFNHTPALLYDIRSLLLPVKPQSLTAKELDEHWAKLASDDPVAANASTWTLQRVPDNELRPFLTKQLGTLQPPAAATIQQWLANLDHANFKEREQATKQLAALGRPSATLLRDAAKKTDSAEVRERLRKILATLGQAPGTPEQRQAYRAVAILERLGSPDAKTLLRTLAKGPELSHATPAAQAALFRLENPAK